MSNSSEEYVKEAFLMSVSGSVEADLIESQLRAYKIPVLKKFKGSSGYINIYAGATNLGVELYVPENALDEAREILSASPEPLETAEPFDYAEYEENHRKNLNKIIWAISIPTVAMILLGILKGLGIF